MSITVIKEGTSLRVLKASKDIPDGTELTLYTAEELTSLQPRRQAWLAAQMPSFVRGDEDEDDSNLFDSPKALHERSLAEERSFEQIGLAEWARQPGENKVDWEAFFGLNREDA